jgi:Ca2+-binding RTX toxin-like protein
MNGAGQGSGQTRGIGTAGTRIVTVLVLVGAACGLIPAAASAADVTVVAAGNIACDASSPYFNGGNGTPGRCHQGATGKLVSTSGANAVLALGSNQYCCGSLLSYQASYDKTWGAVKSITHPIPGTRDYGTAQAAGYFDYFNGPGVQAGPAGLRGLGYYSFDVGDWHMIALNTNCKVVSCAKGSDQERWLRADLAAHPAACTLAFGHSPRFSTGKPHGSIAVKPLWDALYDGGTELVLSAYARDYERFAPQAPSGRLDPTFGIRQFVVGTGGYALGALGALKGHSEIRENTAFGVLALTLHPTGYDWRFIPEVAGAFADSGTGSCHGAPPPRSAPPAPRKGAKRRHCTIVGTPKNDVLRGTRGRDVICGGLGNDVILGRGGNDVLYGDAGNDVLRGGAGNDVMRGGGGRDKLIGGRGRDRLFGDSGNDLLRGQSGNDRLFSGDGRDRLFGNAGNDFLDGSGDRTRDILIGGRGRDRAKFGPLDRLRSVERRIRRRK